MNKKIITQLIIIVVLVLILGVLIYLVTNKKNNDFNNQMKIPQMQRPGEMEMSESSVEVTGSIKVTDEQTLNGNYESGVSDESVILVTDGGNLTVNGATINKTGDATNTEKCDFYGVNAGVLTTKNSTTTIKNTKITTDARGANAVFSTGENSKVYVSDTVITTTGKSSSRGLHSTYGGYIEANNVTISTQGGSSATLATDRGEGTVVVKKSKLLTEGAGSPIIYSTGNITLEESEGTSNGSQMVVVEGKNTATVKNSNLICSGRGNRNNVDNCGIMIYQSMSGDAGEGTGTVNLSDSILEISNSDEGKTSPFFFITNTKAIINLQNNTLKYSSDLLLKAEGTSEWGKSSNNGGEVTLNATKQELYGNIELDNLSTITINLKDNSKLESAINRENKAKSVSLNLDKTSKLKLTGDTYVTELNNEDTSFSNIDFNGYKLYVNGVAIK